MFPPNYLQGDDIAFLCATGCADKIQSASRVIDGYLQRPEGLLYAADAVGNPVCMVGPQPSQSYSAAQPILAGANIIVQLPTTILSSDMVGSPVVIDRKNGSLIEACEIIAVSAPLGQITLRSVSNAHAVGATLDFGLMVSETRTLPERRPITRVSRNPIVRIVSGAGRYSFRRRSDDYSGSMLGEFDLIEDLQQLGGVPCWESFDPLQTSIDRDSGEIFIPSGIYLANFSQVRLYYVAGWTYANLPWNIKQATAMIAQAMGSNIVPTIVKNYKAGPISAQRFSASMLDSDVRRLLDPFKVRAMF